MFVRCFLCLVSLSAAFVLAQDEVPFESYDPCSRPVYCNASADPLPFPNPNDCTEYYFCADSGVWQVTVCPGDTTFDNETRTCSTNGTCQGPCPPEICLPDDETTNCSPLEAKYPDRWSCVHYWECIPGGTYVYRPCPLGTVFWFVSADPKTSFCGYENLNTHNCSVQCLAAFQGTTITTTPTTTTSTSTTTPTPSPPPVTQPPFVAGCGSLLATYTNDSSRLPGGFSIVCYLERSTASPALIDTTCANLLQDLPKYGNSSELLRNSGNFGCWLDSVVPPNDASIQNACFDDYQHDHYLGMCVECPAMTVCIRFPQQ